MRKQTILTLVVGLIAAITLACDTTTPAAPTPDTQATVDATVAATSTAQASTQATIDAAVQATQAAAPSPTPPPTPTADYSTMSEEELAAAIDEAVVEATTTTEQTATATSEVASDGTVMQEEVDEVETYIYDAEEAIAYTEELIYAYYGLYGELALETLELLIAIEEDLYTMADEIAEVNEILTEIEETPSEEDVEQLEAAAATVIAIATEVQAQNQEWLEDLQAEIESRAAQALAVAPNAVASNRVKALLSAFDYVDAVREGLSDQQITQPELANIAQLGANAGASLQAQGGPQLQQLPGSINDITTQIARGQMPQAQANLGSLESMLGARPPRP